MTHTTASGHPITRRAALQSIGAVAGLTAVGYGRLAAGSPNQQLRLGVIGTGVRGKYLIGNLPPTARVVAISDCSEERMAGTLTPTGRFAPILDDFMRSDASACERYQDYRQMIDRASLDAVIIATPDHHHCEAASLALDAGLDVYVEKPLSLTIAEGRALADKVKQTGRVLQVGSQQRTMEVNRFACEFIRDGGLGRISHVDMPNYPGPHAGADFPTEPVPAGLDWSLFLGSAPRRSYNRHWWVKDEFKVEGLLWRGWDLFRDFSGHLVTNWGGHNMDMVQYALGADDTGPVEIAPLRDVPEEALRRDYEKKWHRKTPPPVGAFSDDRRFQPVTMRYASGVRMNFVPDVKTATFYGERGTMEIHRNRFVCDPKGLIVDGPDKAAAAQWTGDGFVARPHLENWIDAIATGGTPNAPVEVGHRTATVCHLVGICRELDMPLRWDPVAERFEDAPAANALRARS